MATITPEFVLAYEELLLKRMALHYDLMPSPWSRWTKSYSRNILEWEFYRYNIRRIAAGKKPIPCPTE